MRNIFAARQADATPKREKAAAQSPEQLPASKERQVVLQIYDVFADDRVQAVNDVFRAVGSGAFHAGVEVYKNEWSYGYTPFHTGIVFCDPKGNPAHRYREALVMGTTPYSEQEVEAILEEMAKEWPGAGANFVAGVSGAASAVNGMAEAAGERAAELDKRYNILHTIDSFTTHEIAIDESYLESKVTDLWTQAVQNMQTVGKNIETVGKLAGKAFDGAKRPADEKAVSTWSNWWSWGPESPESRSKATTDNGRDRVTS